MATVKKRKIILPVSVIILNYNEPDYTKKCIESVKKSFLPKGSEIIVIENGSGDDSVKVLSKVKGIRFLPFATNAGFAGGVNRGVKHAKNRWVAVLNNDALVDKNWLVEAAKVLHDNVAIVSFPVENTGGYYQKEYLGCSLNLFGMPVTVKTDDYFLLPAVLFLLDTSKIPMPFDDEYFLYSEDIYMEWLARMRGYDIVTAYNSKVLHFGGVATSKMKAIVEFHAEKNRNTNLLLFFELKTLLKLFPLLLLSTLLNLAVAIFRGRFFIRLRSYLWVMAHLPDIMRKRRKLQSMRKVKDSILLKKFTLDLAYGYFGMKNLLEGLLKLYCAFVNIKTMEFHKDL